MPSLTDPLPAEMANATVQLLREMVQIRSFNPPGDEAAMSDYVADWLVAAGLTVTPQPVEGARANIVGRLSGAGDQPALVLCAHLDTVPPGEAPWSLDPFAGEWRDGRLYGRGAADTKGSLAAMLIAARWAAQSGQRLAGDLVVLATVDEENNGLGARTYVESGGMQGVAGIVIGEPTSLDLVIAHRGLLWLELTVLGKAAHGAMPERGVNAILPLAAMLSQLQAHQFAYQPDPLLRPPTINIGTVQGGSKINMVPDRCQAKIDLRTVPGQVHAEIVAEVRALAEATARDWPGITVDVQTINDKAPLDTADDHPFVVAGRHVSAVVRGQPAVVRGAPYMTDGSLLAATTRTPAIVCGPGLESMAHQVDEYVEVAELLTAVRLYAGLMDRVLGAA